MRIPELLAPAGGPDAFLAALAAGADAVYLGLDRFNARAAAEGFSLDELARACAMAHRRGVRVYVTMNSLVRDDELDAARYLSGEVLAAGADALIVADVGLCRVLRRSFPAAELHLSTQAGVCSAAGAKLTARELGVARVTCGRELSVAEMRELASAAAGAYEVEAFCHGAICICYAGACAFSAVRRGRSANRGDCTQPCRLSYDLVDEGGASVVAVKGDRLLCPRDYLGIRHVAAMAEAGVAALKIEGRMKNPDYVYNVVGCYRRVIDALAAGEPLGPSELDALEIRLARSFNRGFTDAYPVGGRADGRLMSWERAINQGVRVGEVVERRHEEVVVAFSAEVGAGDTLEIRSTPGPDAPADVPKRWPMVPCPAPAAMGERLVVRCKRKVEVGSPVHLTRGAGLVAEAAAAVGALRAEWEAVSMFDAGADAVPSVRSEAVAPSPAPMGTGSTGEPGEGAIVLSDVHRPADDARVRELCRHAGAVVCRNLSQVAIACEVGVPFWVAEPVAAWNAEAERWLRGLGARGVARIENAPLMVTEHCVLTPEGPCDGSCAVCARRRQVRYLVEQDGSRLRVEVDERGRSRIYLK